MSYKRLARNYADALIAGDPKSVSENIAALAQFADAYADSPELQTALLAPVISLEDKLKAVEVLLDSLKIKGVVRQTVLVLVRNERAFLLPDVVYEAQNIEDEQLARTHVVIETSHDWDKSAQEKFEKGLKIKQARFNWKITPELLGGVRVRIADRVWDGSVRKQIKKIENILTR